MGHSGFTEEDCGRTQPWNGLAVNRMYAGEALTLIVSREDQDSAVVVSAEG